MSCGSEYETQNCITDTLLAIVDAQDKVAPCKKEDETGCDRAINELKGGHKKSDFNTIPIILQLKCSGKPFKGQSGVRGKRTFIENQHCLFIYFPGCRCRSRKPLRIP